MKNRQEVLLLVSVTNFSTASSQRQDAYLPRGDKIYLEPSYRKFSAIIASFCNSSSHSAAFCKDCLGCGREKYCMTQLPVVL
jgi:hypothetical protein